MLLGLIRSSLLIARKVKYSLNWSECESYADGPNSTEQDEPVEPDDDDKTYFQTADLLYVVHSLLHWPEYVFLIYGTYTLIKEVQLWDLAMKLTIWKTIKSFFCKCQIGSIVSIIAVLIFIVASLVVPLLSIADAYEENQEHPNCDRQSTELKIHYVYQVLSFLAHIVSPGIRIYMAVMVLVVQAIWNHQPYEKTNDQTLSDDASTTEVWKAASSKYYDCIEDYELRHDKIIAVLRVFRAWFVIQWFINYFQFLVDLSQVLRPWLGSGTTFDLPHIRRMIYTLYDFLAFAIPHVSGLKMNRHHEAYLNRLRKKQLKDARDTNQKCVSPLLRRYASRNAKAVTLCQPYRVPALPFLWTVQAMHWEYSLLSLH